LLVDVTDPFKKKKILYTLARDSSKVKKTGTVRVT